MVMFLRLIVLVFVLLGTNVAIAEVRPGVKIGLNASGVNSYDTKISCHAGVFVNIDLNKSYAYGDTNGDINMLRRVGNPIAINPTKELLSHIASDPVISKTSQIIVERKDIIYSLSPNVDILDI